MTVVRAAERHKMAVLGLIVLLGLGVRVVGLGLVGAQFLSLGLLGEMMTRTCYES